MSVHNPISRYCIVIAGIPLDELRDDVACPVCDDLRMLMELDPDVEVLTEDPTPRTAEEIAECMMTSFHIVDGDVEECSADYIATIIEEAVKEARA